MEIERTQQQIEEVSLLVVEIRKYYYALPEKLQKTFRHRTYQRIGNYGHVIFESLFLVEQVDILAVLPDISEISNKLSTNET